VVKNSSCFLLPLCVLSTLASLREIFPDTPYWTKNRFYTNIKTTAFLKIFVFKKVFFILKGRFL